MNLSKSKFIAGLQCLKRLYLQVHEPTLAGELDEQTQAVMEQGQEVGRWAQKLFPGGLLIEASHEELNKAIGLTERAVTNKGLPALFESTFVRQGPGPGRHSGAAGQRQMAVDRGEIVNRPQGLPPV
jgi:hypothetical protein